MKKILWLFFVLFLFLLNSEVYGFDNKYFSVSDKGWKITNNTDKCVSFELDPLPENNQISSDSKILVNVIIIGAEDDDKEECSYYYVEYNEEQLAREIKFMNSQYESLKQDYRIDFIKFLTEEKPDVEPELIKAYAHDYFDKNSNMGKVFLDKTPNHKAYIGEFRIANTCFRYIDITTLNRVYILAFNFISPLSKENEQKCYEILSNLEPYKEFINSFKAKDKEATKTLSYLYAYGWTILFVVAIAIEIGVKIARKVKAKLAKEFEPIQPSQYSQNSQNQQNPQNSSNNQLL